MNSRRDPPPPMPKSPRPHTDQAATGVKFDGGKPPVDLVPAEFVLSAARAFAYGAVKYSRHNWRGGMKYSRLFSSLQRHLLAWNEGEELDPESGLSHLDHAAASLAMLVSMVKHRTDLDDRHHIGENTCALSP